jgi:hypothetical protein
MDYYQARPIFKNRADVLLHAHQEIDQILKSRDEFSNSTDQAMTFIGARFPSTASRRKPEFRCPSR